MIILHTSWLFNIAYNSAALSIIYDNTIPPTSISNLFIGLLLYPAIFIYNSDQFNYVILPVRDATSLAYSYSFNMFISYTYTAYLILLSHI